MGRGVTLRYARVFLKIFMRLQRAVYFIVPIKRAKGNGGMKARMKGCAGGNGSGNGPR